MDIEILRQYCLSKPGVTESFPFDAETLVFKVMNKMFAIIPLERGGQIALKCDPDRAIELREEWEEITAGYHLNKTHWNSVRVNGRLPSGLVKELIDHSYDLIVASLKKKDREELFQLGNN